MEQKKPPCHNMTPAGQSKIPFPKSSIGYYGHPTSENSEKKQKETRITEVISSNHYGLSSILLFTSFTSSAMRIQLLTLKHSGSCYIFLRNWSVAETHSPRDHGNETKRGPKFGRKIREIAGDRKQIAGDSR